MHFVPLTAEGNDLGGLMVALVAGEGSGAHGWLHAAELNVGPLASRNMADLLQLLALLHGTQPGLIETCFHHNMVPQAEEWLLEAGAGFAAERDYLARLAVAAGPPPGTPGETGSVAAVLAQRHALDTIGQSDRYGCALGAAVALTLDWQPIRATLDTAAERLGVAPPPDGLPSEDATAALLGALPDRLRLDRTLAFGARQVLLHHQGLFDLLETRAEARGG